MLEMKDYVTISRGSGTVVNKLSTFEIERAINYMLRFNLVSRLDILEMRNICETIAASWASDRRTQKDIDVMQGILEHSKTVIEDRAAFISCGIDFTNSMARSSKNDLIYIISRMTSMFSHDRYSKKTSLTEMLKEHNTILLQHQEILQAISDKDAELAKALTLKHLSEVSEILS
jgi:DNA-binding FadR family transcriptional regulator